DQQSVPAGVHQQSSDAGTGQVEVVPATLGLETFEVEVQLIEVQEGDVLLRQVRLIGGAFVLAARYPVGLHGLNLRVPVQHHLVLLQVGRSGLKVGARGLEGRNRSQLAEGVAKLGLDAVDLLLEADRLERLRAQVPDDRQDEIDAFFVGG